MPELSEAFDNIEDNIEKFVDIYHEDKKIGKVHRATKIGEINGFPQYNAYIELQDDKYESLFKARHRIIAQEGKLVLETDF